MAGGIRGKKTVADGMTFDSAQEAARWLELRSMEAAGQIRSLMRQVRYPIKINGSVVCTYCADFVYEERLGSNWVQIVEDWKGPMSFTPEYQLKKKLMRAVYGIDIRETGSKKYRKKRK